MTLPADLDAKADAHWKRHEAHLLRLGKIMRHWLKCWCRRYLESNPDVNWVRVEIEESEEHFGLHLANVSTDAADRDERAQDDLFKWAAFIRYGVPNGSWVRVTREGKVYREKRGKADSDVD